MSTFGFIETALQAESYLHSFLAFIGFVLVITRLHLASDLNKDKFQWWAWVGAHALMAIGFFAAATRPIYGTVEPRMSEWFLRLGLVAYLALMLWIESRESEESQ